MSIVLWLADRWSDEPKEQVYAKETKHFGVRHDGRRDAKVSSYSCLFSTKQEAQQWIDQSKAKRLAETKLRLTREAAPDLLEALEAIIPFIPNTSASEGGAARFSANVAAADKVRAAIAKARGEA